MRVAILAWLLIAGLSLACVGDPQPRTNAGAPEGGMERSPGIGLVPSQEIEGDFLVRQLITVTTSEGNGNFEAVVQNSCGTLVVAGLSPVGTRLFSIQQSGLEVKVEAIRAGNWPFEPERILLDVHRTYFYPLADPPLSDGLHELRFGTESLRERWHAGRLVERRVALGAHDESEWISITYGYVQPPDRTADPRWRSRSVRLENPLFGYTLEIDTAIYQSLRCEEEVQ